MAGAVAIGVLVVMAVAGRSRLSGPVLLSLSGTHGVHAGDLAAVVLGAMAVIAVWLLGRP